MATPGTKDPLKRIRSFALAANETGAAELSRQLTEFEENVSNMGAGVALAAMPRLRERPGPARTNGIMVGPGEFRTLDTRGGTIRLSLPKPTAKDAGTFIVLIDLGGGAGSVFIEAAQGCKFDSVISAFVNVTGGTYVSLIFCDGANYWRVT